MNIVFNLLNCGLGNNGGSKTILMCQNVLLELGHQVEILTAVDNFTWFPHKKVITKLPKNIEVLVATACSTVNHTIYYPGNFKKVWYIRGHEIWSMDENRLKNLYRTPRILNIVNSKGLQSLLLDEFQARSEVVYQGIDLDLWYRLNDAKKKSPIRIGCLYHSKSSKNWRIFAKLARLLQNETLGKYEFVSYGNIANDDNFLTEYYEKPSHEELLNLYNSCHIFLCPTSLEGLHNVGLEAALCGCLIICNNNPLNGMIKDYAFEDKTAMIYEEGNIQSIIDKINSPKWELVDPMIEHITKNIGSRKQNMKKFVEKCKGA